MHVHLRKCGSAAARRRRPHSYFCQGSEGSDRSDPHQSLCSSDSSLSHDSLNGSACGDEIRFRNCSSTAAAT